MVLFAAVLGVLDEIGADEVIISREQRPGLGAIGFQDRKNNATNKLTHKQKYATNKK